MSKKELKLTENLEKIFGRDMYTNNIYMNPEAYKKHMEKRKRDEKANRKVRFKLIETGRDLPNCRRCSECEITYLHSSKCYNRESEYTLDRKEFEKRWQILSDSFAIKNDLNGQLVIWEFSLPIDEKKEN